VDNEYFVLKLILIVTRLLTVLLQAYNSESFVNIYLRHTIMRRRPCKVPWFCTAIGFAIGAFLGKNFEALSDYFPLTLGLRVHAAEIVRHDLL
uniref:Uncharacterized protein n=1 Tax=Romanomermis culicivorax TaxID=13658 RepID=A0A915INU1_ROMCU